MLRFKWLPDPYSADRRTWVRLGVAGFVLVVLLAAAVPEWQVSSVRGSLPVDKVESLKIEHRRILLQAIGGGALLVGLWLTGADIKVAEDGQVTERFAKAIELLRDDNVSARLGAIYALERIARDSARDHWPIMEVLAAYVRERAPWPPPQTGGKQRSKSEASRSGWLARRPRDIQAVVTVIGRRHGYGQGSGPPGPVRNQPLARSGSGRFEFRGRALLGRETCRTRSGRTAALPVPASPMPTWWRCRSRVQICRARRFCGRTSASLGWRAHCYGDLRSMKVTSIRSAGYDQERRGLLDVDTKVPF